MKMRHSGLDPPPTKRQRLENYSQWFEEELRFIEGYDKIYPPCIDLSLSNLYLYLHRPSTVVCCKVPDNKIVRSSLLAASC